ncbi:MAG TPA: T9SS type A sorting domain-containing protein [Aquaticitalea sp.]|nr:T9SS type A sorting domain-containing protein [Aquaticitalea sp.]
MKHVTTFFILLFSSGLFAQPSLDWLTYFGEQTGYYSRTQPSQILYDSISGHIYMAGVTSDTLGIATPGAHQEMLYNSSDFGFTERDIFLSKWDTSGNLIWSTYYGGLSADRLGDAALDAEGNILLTGTNEGHTNITTPGAFQEFTVYEPGMTVNPNIFLSKFSPDGTLLWGTYFGLGGNTAYSGLAIDPATNDIYMTGMSTYPGLGTSGTFQPDFFGGVADGFIAKFDASGNRIWCTYLGGEDTDDISNIVLSEQGYLYVCGTTRSATNIASPGAEIEDREAGTNNMVGFLAKFDTSGNRIWCTYLGGEGPFDVFFDIKTTSYEPTGEERVFVSGIVQSTTLGTAGTFGPTYGGGARDMVLLKYNQSGQKQWGTYIGGNGSDAPNNLSGFTNSLIMKGSYGDEEMQVAGGTQSADFYFDGPECSYAPHTGNRKGFVASLDTTGNLNWSSPFDDGISSIGPAGGDRFFIVGATDIDGLATSGAHMDTKEPGSISGFLGSINLDHCSHETFEITMDNGILFAPFGYQNHQWTMDGVDIPGAVYESLDISGYGPGVFTVRFRDDCRCRYETAEYDTETASVPDASGSGTVYVYPNPAGDILQMANLKGSVSVSVYNMVGQKVLYMAAVENHEAIPVAHLPLGMYMVRLLDDGGRENFIKFTKR